MPEEGVRQREHSVSLQALGPDGTQGPMSNISIEGIYYYCTKRRFVTSPSNPTDGRLIKMCLNESIVFFQRPDLMTIKDTVGHCAIHLTFPLGFTPFLYETSNRA